MHRRHRHCSGRLDQLARHSRAPAQGCFTVDSSCGGRTHNRIAGPNVQGWSAGWFGPETSTRFSLRRLSFSQKALLIESGNRGAEASARHTIPLSTTCNALVLSDEDAYASETFVNSQPRPPTLRPGRGFPWCPVHAYKTSLSIH